ncbi:MAG: uroporphyrinogen-III synthase [Chloroflexi bacterium]|nr:uroporphyrinogen-III synthase [Chloroflexota bacterium]
MSSLRGKRVLVTRPREQYAALARLLEAQGALPIAFPTIAVEPVEDTRELDAALLNLAGFDWLVFTSANGVDAAWGRMDALGISALPGGLRLAAIGPKTAAALRGRGAEPELVPGEYIAEAILPGLGDLRDRRVLLLRADLARETLPGLIRAAGGVAVDITAYRTRPATPDAYGLAALRAGVDAVVFTSPSTVRNFARLCERESLDPGNLPGSPALAAIGPVTTGALTDHGLSADIVAKTYTAEGLVEALAAHFISQQDWNPA